MAVTMASIIRHLNQRADILDDCVPSTARTYREAISRLGEGNPLGVAAILRNELVNHEEAAKRPNVREVRRQDDKVRFGAIRKAAKVRGMLEWLAVRYDPQDIWGEGWTAPHIDAALKRVRSET